MPTNSDRENVNRGTKREVTHASTRTMNWKVSACQMSAQAPAPLTARATATI
jgi:hypothetical protein